MMLEPFLALRVQAPAAAAEHPSKEQTDALASQRTFNVFQPTICECVCRSPPQQGSTGPRRSRPTHWLASERFPTHHL